MNFKKILATVVAAAMMLSSMGMIAFAEGNVANIGDTSYQTVDEAFAAAKNGDEVEINQAGTYSVPTGKSITITGTVDGVVFDDIGKRNMNGANVTFNKVTFDYYPNVNYTGLQHSGNLVYNNCTINGQVFLYGVSETFNECTFNQNDANAYNVWTYGAKAVKFNKCTLNCVGKSVLIYHEGTPSPTVLEVVDTKFVASAPVEGKAAIEIDSSLLKDGDTYTVIVDDKSEATGFAKGNVSGNSLWNNKLGELAEVTVAGEKVLEIKKAISGTLVGTLVDISNPACTFISVQLANVNAAEEVKVELYDSNDTLLATTKSTDLVLPLLPIEELSPMICITGSDSYWTTEWSKLRADYIPAYATLYIDGTKMNSANINMATTSGEHAIEWAEVPGVPAAGEAQVGGTVYETLAKAVAAAEAGDVIELISDVTLTEGIVLNDGTVMSDITLDGNNNTITLDMNGAGTGLRFGADPKNGAWATGVKIKDLNITGSANYALWLNGGTSSELTNVTITGTYNDVYGALVLYGTHGATLTNCDIVSGFTNGQDDYPVNLVNSKIGHLAANNGEEGSGAKVFLDEDSSIEEVVCGGDSSAMIDAASIERIGTVLLATGETWADTVTPVVEVNGVLYATLQAAVDFSAKSGSTAVVTIIKPIVITEDTTIDLKGVTVKAADEIMPAIRVTNGATLTVSNGTIDNEGGYVFILGSSDSSTSGNLVINSGTYKGETSVASVTNGTLTINGGNFEAYDAGYGTGYLINCIDANYKSGIAKVAINGGTFVGFNPQSNAAEGTDTVFTTDGYKATEVNGVYTVVAEDAKETELINNTELAESALSYFTGETAGTKWCAYKFTLDFTGTQNLKVTVKKDTWTKEETKAITANIEGPVAIGVIATGIDMLDSITVDAE